MSASDDSVIATWADFYVAERRVLTAYALALTGNADSAADLIQDVLVGLIRTRRAPENVKAYVLRCLRNRAADQARRRGDAATSIDGVHVAFIDARSLSSETEQLARTALSQLSPPQREAIVLKVFAELTLREIAVLLERPPGTVASDYARGIAALRAALTEEGSHAKR